MRSTVVYGCAGSGCNCGRPFGNSFSTTRRVVPCRRRFCHLLPPAVELGIQVTQIVDSLRKKNAYAKNVFHSVTSPFFAHFRATVLGRSNTEHSGTPPKPTKWSARVRISVSATWLGTKSTAAQRDHFSREQKNGTTSRLPSKSVIRTTMVVCVDATKLPTRVTENPDDPEDNSYECQYRDSKKATVSAVHKQNDGDGVAPTDEPATEAEHDQVRLTNTGYVTRIEHADQFFPRIEVEMQRRSAQLATLRDDLQDEIDYITANQQRMDYRRYHELGLPIGSGTVLIQPPVVFDLALELPRAVGGVPCALSSPSVTTW